MLREITHIVTYVALATENTPVRGVFYTMRDRGDVNKQGLSSTHNRIILRKHPAPLRRLQQEALTVSPKEAGWQLYKQYLYRSHIRTTDLP